MKRLIIAVIIMYLSISVANSADVKFVGQFEGAISTDFNSHGSHSLSRPFEIFNHNKGLFAINNAYLGAEIKGKDYYGVLTGQFGNFRHGLSNANDFIIQEALIGYRITNDLRAEAGFLLTEKGKEIFLNNEHSTNSNHWLTFFVPIHNAGAGVIYKPKKQYKFSFYVLNSVYDRESRTGNLAFNPSFVYSDSIVKVKIYGIYGNEKYTDYELFTMYNVLSADFSIIDDLNIGAEYIHFGLSPEPRRRAVGRSLNNLSLKMQYRFLDVFSLATRISALDNSDELWSLPEKITYDAAISLQYKPSNKSYIRFEFRNLQLDGKGRDNFIFNDNLAVSYRSDIILTFGFSFDKLLKDFE